MDQQEKIGGVTLDYTFYDGKMLKVWRAKHDVFLENMFSEELIGDVLANEAKMPGRFSLEPCGLKIIRRAK